ncbi:MAG: hypothetical protein ABEK12_02140, partial [Candidatus Nanohaloarchaea archaeon]
HGPFDYFVTADQDGRGVSGTDRWGDYPAAVPADTDTGEELIENGWEYTVDAYQRHLDAVEEFLDDHDPEALWADGDVHREYHYSFHRVGEYTGPGTFLYDQDGGGIRHRDRLDEIYSKQDPGYDDGTDLYVVPADVHY